jgi:4a-hydroxytetrahydrobiopterin dehydratase
MGGMKLSTQDITERLGALPGWTVQGDALTRQFTFATYPDGIAFVVRLAFAAQEKDHHPDLVVGYRKVTVAWSSHSEGGITDKDFDGARQSDAIARGLGA